MDKLIISLMLFLCVVCGLVLFGLYLRIFFESIKRKYFLVSLALLILPFNIHNIFQLVHQLKALPSEIKVVYPVAIGTEGDLVDGCDVTVFKLSEPTIKNIETLGIKFFGSAVSNDYENYNGWKETPTLPIWKINRGEDSPIRCAVISDTLLNQLTEAMMQKGAYYTANSRMELMVIPTLGFAVIIDVY